MQKAVVDWLTVLLAVGGFVSVAFFGVHNVILLAVGIIAGLAMKWRPGKKAPAAAPPTEEQLAEKTEADADDPADQIEAAADKLFDYVELSKRTLGLSWNKFSMDQRKEFVGLFKTLLRNTYIDKITGYTNQKVNFTKEVQLSETTTEVQSIVVSPNAQTPVNYRVIKKDNDWKVYDVVIEGVSLVSNYRTQFREILGNNPPQTLIDTLRKRAGK